MLESPRWLLCKGRKDEAFVILKKMVKLNGRELPKDIELKVPVSTALYIVHIILIFHRLIFRKEYVEIKSRKTFTYLLKLKSMSFFVDVQQIRVIFLWRFSNT